MYLAETICTHGHDCYTNEDVDTGHDDTDDVSVAVEGDSDGDEEREGVEETVNHGDIMNTGHDDSAKHQV